MKMNFSLAPTPFSLSPNTDVISKLAWFFGHYDLRVYISSKAYVDVGRGSLGGALRLSRAFTDYSGRVISIGQFCDFSSTCELLPGGEHRNDNNVNVAFSTIVPFQMAAASEAVQNLAPLPAAGIVIGNGVVVSAGALILSNVDIGNGALIAANATVRTRVEPFCIYGGLPARLLRPRVSSERRAAMESVRWWDFDTVYLGNNLARLQELAVDTATAHIYRKATPKFALKVMTAEGRPPEVQLLGCVVDEKLIGLDAVPANIRAYLSQIATNGPYAWHANIWDE
jgi:acetyltransferase-like isoleucine patch superfamily enzyme